MRSNREPESQGCLKPHTREQQGWPLGELGVGDSSVNGEGKSWTGRVPKSPSLETGCGSPQDTVLADGPPPSCPVNAIGNLHAYCNL